MVGCFAQSLVAGSASLVSGRTRPRVVTGRVSPWLHTEAHPTSVCFAREHRADRRPLPEHLITALDDLVARGLYDSRAAAVRAGIDAITSPRPVTRAVRSIPTELPLGADDGMPMECAASFDNLTGRTQGVPGRPAGDRGQWSDT